MNFLKPKTMYKVGIGGVIVNLIFAVVAWSIGLPMAYAHIFLASGLCFLVGAVANCWMMKIQNHK